MTSPAGDIFGDLRDDRPKTKDGRGGKERGLNAKGYRVAYELAKEMATEGMLAARFGVDRETFRRMLDRDPKLRRTVTLGYEETKQELRSIQLQSARNGAVAMQMWLGKQYLGQSEKTSIEWGAEFEESEAVSTLVELQKRAKARLAEVAKEGKARVPTFVGKNGQPRDQHGKVMSTDPAKWGKRPSRRD